MAFEKDKKYWKIVDIKIDRQLKKANVILVGFKDKEDAAKPKLAQWIPGYPKKTVVLEGDNFPFVETTPEVKKGVKMSQTAFTYVKVKEIDKYFKEAKDV